jgi:hypothetical protein
VVAALLLSAVAVSVPLTGFETSSESALEACQACQSCEDGRCGDSPLAGSDHCCPSSCQAHSVWTLTGAVTVGAALLSEAAPEAEFGSPRRPVPGDIAQPPQA